jgi:hypothetical protein
MGFETANVHHGSRDAMAAVRADLAKRSVDWLIKNGYAEDGEGAGGRLEGLARQPPA